MYVRKCKKTYSSVASCMWKMMCNKVVCESMKDGVSQSCVWKMVWNKAVREWRKEEAGYRIKNKSPTQRRGEQFDYVGGWMSFARIVRLDLSVGIFKAAAKRQCAEADHYPTLDEAKKAQQLGILQYPWSSVSNSRFSRINRLVIIFWHL